MKKVYKYNLSLNDVQTIMLPANAEILHVDVQRGYPVLWARIETEEVCEDKFVIRIAGTGHPDAWGTYINTFFVDGLVFHAFYAD